MIPLLEFTTPLLMVTLPELKLTTASKPISPIWSQVHKHFRSTFFANFLQKHAHKMLVKLTPVVYFTIILGTPFMTLVFYKKIQTQTLGTEYLCKHTGIQAMPSSNFSQENGAL